MQVSLIYSLVLGFFFNNVVSNILQLGICGSNTICSLDVWDKSYNKMFKVAWALFWPHQVMMMFKRQFILKVIRANVTMMQTMKYPTHHHHLVK